MFWQDRVDRVGLLCSAQLRHQQLEAKWARFGFAAFYQSVCLAALAKRIIWLEMRLMMKS